MITICLFVKGIRVTLPVYFACTETEVEHSEPSVQRWNIYKVALAA